MWRSEQVSGEVGFVILRKGSSSIPDWRDHMHLILVSAGSIVGPRSGFSSGSAFVRASRGSEATTQIEQQR